MKDHGILGTKKEISVYEKEIWNAAIEQAALLTDKRDLIGMKQMSEDIRKLKVQL